MYKSLFYAIIALATLVCVNCPLVKKVMLYTHAVNSYNFTIWKNDHFRRIILINVQLLFNGGPKMNLFMKKGPLRVNTKKNFAVPRQNGTHLI